MIVTISGASGVGKTTIQKIMLKRSVNTKVVVSVTTVLKSSEMGDFFVYKWCKVMHIYSLISREREVYNVSIVLNCV